VNNTKGVGKTGVSNGGKQSQKGSERGCLLQTKTGKCTKKKKSFDTNEQLLNKEINYILFVVFQPMTFRKWKCGNTSRSRCK